MAVKESLIDNKYCYRKKIGSCSIKKAPISLWIPACAGQPVPRFREACPGVEPALAEAGARDGG